MAADNRTMEVYAASADAYADRFARKNDPEQAADAAAFLALVPKGGLILDFGCGPGQWAATFADAGYCIDATDASPEMVALARDRFGLEVRLETFEALLAVAHYDGIWANFSLLHAARAEFPDHLARIHRALKPGGALHLAMKLGVGEKRDQLGRFFAFFTADELVALTVATGFTIMETRESAGSGLAGSVDPFLSLTARA